jgi:hypothetical protein
VQSEESKRMSVMRKIKRKDRKEFSIARKVGNETLTACVGTTGISTQTVLFKSTTITGCTMDSHLAKMH